VLVLLLVIASFLRQIDHEHEHDYEKEFVILVRLATFPARER
jgi:hypothetical protein